MIDSMSEPPRPFRGEVIVLLSGFALMGLDASDMPHLRSTDRL
jgi:hypothetical protein